MTEATRCLNAGIIYDDTDLVEEIASLHKEGLQPPEMLQRLCSSGWSDLSMSQLTKLRHQNGLLLHTPAGQEEAAIEKARKIVKEQLESGVSSRYGLVYATSSAKLTSDTFLPRVAVKRALEEIDPAGIDYRAQE